MEKLRIIAVYKLTNTSSGRFYIGSSVDIRTRWRNHLSALVANRHQNQFLQRDFNAWTSAVRNTDFMRFEAIRVIEPEETNEKTIKLLRDAEQAEIDRVFGDPLCMNALSQAVGLHFFPEEWKAQLRQLKSTQTKELWSSVRFQASQAQARSREEYRDKMRKKTQERLLDPVERSKMTSNRSSQMKDYWNWDRELPI